MIESLDMYKCNHNFIKFVGKQTPKQCNINKTQEIPPSIRIFHVTYLF